MKSMMKSVVNNETVRLILFGLMFVAAAMLVFAIFGALIVYVHPMAALMFLGVLIAVLGYLYDR